MQFELKDAQRLCGNIDKMIKGLIKYDVWQALSDTLTMLAKPDAEHLKLTRSKEFQAFCHL